MENENSIFWTWCGWEPLQFYRRLGGYHEQQVGNAEWAGQWMRTIQSEKAAIALNKSGINWVTTHLYKAFGLKIEKEEMAATARMIKAYHKHGVKVFTYIQYGTVMPETIVSEEKSSSKCGRLDANGQHDGHPYEYGSQYWRAKPCANSIFKDGVPKVKHPEWYEGATSKKGWGPLSMTAHAGTKYLFERITGLSGFKFLLSSFAHCFFNAVSHIT